MQAVLANIGERARRHFVVISGPPGVGKSLVATSAQAQAAAYEIEHLFVNPGTEPGDVARACRNDSLQFLVVDDFDRCRESVQKLIKDYAPALPLGAFVTATHLGIWIQQEPFVKACRIELCPLEQRAEDVVGVADRVWAEIVGPDVPLSSECDRSALEQLEAGPWPSGGSSIRRCLELLRDRLLTEGVLQGTELIRRLTNVEIQTALLEMIREQDVPHQDMTHSSAHLVVEGQTDVTYLVAAARLSAENHSHDPLEGILLVDAAGATNVVARLISFDQQGLVAIGVFDRDEMGIRGKKYAESFGQTALVLPPEMNPLGDGAPDEFEIEDLIPSELLERFYEENPEHQMDSRIQRGGMVRIIVGGPHKQECADWVADHASYEDLQKFSCLLYMTRDRLRLSSPNHIPDRKEWLESFRN